MYVTDTWTLLPQMKNNSGLELLAGFRAQSARPYGMGFPPSTLPNLPYQQYSPNHCEHTGLPSAPLQGWWDTA